MQLRISRIVFRQREVFEKRAALFFAQAIKRALNPDGLRRVFIIEVRVLDTIPFLINCPEREPDSVDYRGLA